MTLDQINSIREAGEFINPDLTISTVGEVTGELCINDLVPLRLAACSRSLSRALDIPIEDNTGLQLGCLCICTERVFDPSAFTLNQYVAYLVDSPTSEPSREYRFQYDYVVIRKEHLETYLAKLQHSAPLWGGFVHSTRHSVIPASVTASDTKIIAPKTICLPTPIHERLAMRSVASATPSERYLQLYHQLELLFDWVVVQEIRQLSEDLLGAGKVLSAYASGDLPRLNSLLTRYLSSPDCVVKELGALRTYEAEGQKIFLEYGKDGNPLKESWPKWMECVRSSEPTEVNLRLFKVPLDAGGYRTFIFRLTAYFIYRVRCCVAHSKIGEYVLRDTDEEFVVRFAEPLLRSVLKDILSSEKILEYAGGRLVPEI